MMKKQPASRSPRNVGLQGLPPSFAQSLFISLLPALEVAEMVSPRLLVSLQEGVARLSFAARVERAQLYRVGSASKKDGLAASFVCF